MRVLVVEDSSAMRRVIKNSIIKFLNVDFIEASNGGEAMDILKIEDDIELIITDWLMPSVDGIDLTKYVKSDDRLKDIPVLMVTTNSTRYDIIEAIKAGVSDYIVKPINPNLLESKIKSIIAKMNEGKEQEKIGELPTENEENVEEITDEKVEVNNEKHNESEEVNNESSNDANENKENSK